MTVGIVIQARMTSTRPGKVMAILENKPVLQRVIDQCRKVPFADKDRARVRCRRRIGADLPAV
jgi:spore coat polysaccharide biosynthesis protein SpsF (cytidylyltransferase family)